MIILCYWLGYVLYYRDSLNMVLMLQFIDFGFSFSLFYATHKGLGLHDYDLNPHDRASLNQANYVFTVLYVSTLIKGRQMKKLRSRTPP